MPVAVREHGLQEPQREIGAPRAGLATESGADHGQALPLLDSLDVLDQRPPGKPVRGRPPRLGRRGDGVRRLPAQAGPSRRLPWLSTAPIPRTPAPALTLQPVQRVAAAAPGDPPTAAPAPPPAASNAQPQNSKHIPCYHTPRHTSTCHPGRKSESDTDAPPSGAAYLPVYAYSGS